MRIAQHAGMLLAALALLAACGSTSVQQSPAGAPTATSAATRLALASGAFAANGPIPSRYTRDGEGISPPPAWRDPPEQTTAFALLMEDPDASTGTFTHWVLFNLPAAARRLPEAPCRRRASGRRRAPGEEQRWPDRLHRPLSAPPSG